MNGSGSTFCIDEECVFFRDNDSMFNAYRERLELESSRLFFTFRQFGC